ncbi:MAG: hypothetical protein JWO95_669 [Verrucomicrobiales bacterium]|nr:hypothetical protein [Verrucomicrobiales bacterium]
MTTTLQDSVALTGSTPTTSVNTEPSSAPETHIQPPPSAVPTKCQHPPHPSKISSLPSELREFLNESIHNHVPRKTIIEALAQKGHPGINPVNITKWTKSGYQLWLQERERFQCLRLKMEDADKHYTHLDDAGQNRANRVNGILIDLHMAQIMRDFDPNVLKSELEKDPLQFFKFVRATHTRSLDRQRDERINLQREKMGDTETGPTEFGRQAVKEALGLPDSWIAPTPTRPSTH